MKFKVDYHVTLYYSSKALPNKELEPTISEKLEDCKFMKFQTYMSLFVVISSLFVDR